MFLDFIDPMQNHCLFHQSSAKTVRIFRNHLKRNCVYCLLVIVGGDVSISFGCEFSINASISDEMIMHFGNWPKKMHIL